MIREEFQMAHPDILNHRRAKQAVNDIATILKVSTRLTFQKIQIQVNFSSTRNPTTDSTRQVADLRVNRTTKHTKHAYVAIPHNTHTRAHTHTPMHAHKQDNQPISIGEVIKGGSLGHGTAVPGDFDLDIVIYSPGKILQDMLHTPIDLPT